MAKDVDAVFPNLSKVVVSHGRSLNELAKSANARKDTYLQLSDCSWFVCNQMPRSANGDPINYLSTLDEYARRSYRIPLKLWKRLRGSSSHFLDTLVEAAWAIYLSDKGLSVDHPDVPIPSSQKDVDFVVTWSGKEWWLDVLSVGHEQLRTPPITCNLHQSAVCRSIDSAVSQLKEKIRRKYKEKFKEAVNLGLLNGKSAGILLCVMKENSPLVHQRIPDVPSEELSTFFSNMPGLDLVWIHTLVPRAGQDILRPIILYKWCRDGLSNRLEIP